MNAATLAGHASLQKRFSDAKAGPKQTNATDGSGHEGRRCSVPADVRSGIMGARLGHGSGVHAHRAVRQRWLEGFVHGVAHARERCSAKTGDG